MRGPTRIGLLAISVVCMFALTASSALGVTLREKAAGKILREVGTVPKDQPDALEFNNNGNVVLVTNAPLTITCEEIELGTTVVKNPGAPLVLAVPFGVAEGDQCTAPGVGNVLTYFDTTAEGAVGNAAVNKVATVGIEKVGAVFIAKVHNLKFSQSIAGKFCVGNVDEKLGEVKNRVGAIVEEKPPNLNVQFTETVIPITNGEGTTGCPTEAKLTANFFLETMSGEFDEAFVE